MSRSPATGETHVVIGGSGFLGSSIVRALKGRGEANVSVFDVVAPANRVEKVVYALGDLTDPAALSKAFREALDLSQGKPLVVYHTASPVIGRGKDLYEKVNVVGTDNVVKVCKKEGARALVFTSSAGVIYDGNDLINVDERMPFPDPPLDVYNDTKARAENIVLAANDSSAGGLKTCALRPAGIFGPYDRQALPGFFSVLKQGRTHFQIGPNTNLFDWTYVDNVAHAHLLAADKLGKAGYHAEKLSTYHLPNKCLGEEERPAQRKPPTSEARGSPPGAEDYGRSLPSTLSAQARDYELDVRSVPRNKYDQFFHQVNPTIASPGSPNPEAPLNEEELGVDGEAFFITNGQPVPFWDFPRALWAATGYTLDTSKVWVIGRDVGLFLATASELFSKLTFRTAEFTRYKITYSAASRYYNIEKARRLLGYEPLVGMSEAVKRSAEWWMSEHPEDFKGLGSKSG